jgi:hypothetical protein
VDHVESRPGLVLVERGEILGDLGLHIALNLDQPLDFVSDALRGLIGRLATFDSHERLEDSRVGSL